MLIVSRFLMVLVFLVLCNYEVSKFILLGKVNAEAPKHPFLRAKEGKCDKFSLKIKKN